MPTVAPTHAEDERLLQERYSSEPWKLLTCCALLNNTTRKQVNRVLDGDGELSGLFERWPNSHVMQLAQSTDVRRYVTPLGLQNKRSVTLIRLANDWQKLLLNSFAGIDPPLEYVANIYGVGEYALDSYAWFVLGDFGEFRSGDKELRKWLEKRDR